MGLKLYLDDIRTAPEGFILFRPHDLPMFYHLAKHAEVISMDHDLGLDPEGKEYPNGDMVLRKLEEQACRGHIWTSSVPQILIHSANPVGRQNMENTIAGIHRHCQYYGATVQGS